MYRLRFLLLLILLAACQEDTVEPEITGSLSGSIMDEEGQGLSWALIETSPPTSIVMTDSTGNFTIEHIPAGEYAVMAQKQDYRNGTVNITVRENLTTQVLITLEEKAIVQPTGTLQGILADAVSNVPIAHANISTYPPTVALLTNELGQFAIDSLSAGNYTLKVKKSGYQEDSVQVAVAGGKPTEVTLLMEPVNQTTYNQPVQPNPASLATELTDSLTLRWTIKNPRPDAFLRFTVLLYESGNPVGKTLAEDIADTSVAVTGLTFNTTYFWQVIAKDQNGNTTVGDLWSFQTEPFPDISYLFNQRIEGNQEIFAADETLRHKVRLTQQPAEDVYPQLSANRQWIAYVSHPAGKPQIFVMQKDGTEKVQVTQLPVAGYHNYGEGFCWSPDGGQLLYSHYDKLYRINRDGTHLTLLATAPEGRHFKACDWSGVTRKIVVQTMGADINNSELYLMNENGGDTSLVVDNLPGRIECPSFSIDGKKLLFTQDKSGFASDTGRQLDACVFLLDMGTQQITDLSVRKPEGSNDTHPRFSPNGAYIIFENSSNEADGPKSIWKMNLSGEDRQLLIENGEFPDWG